MLDENIFCRKCGSREKIELHHLVPKCCGGEDKDGRKYFCKKCHDIIGGLLLSLVWKFVHSGVKEGAKLAMKNFTLNWIKKE